MIKKRKSDREATLSILYRMFLFFCIVTTALIISDGFRIWTSGNDRIINGMGLLYYPLFAFVAVTPTLLQIFFESRTRAGFIVMSIVDFALTAILVLGMMLCFDLPHRDISISRAIVLLFIYGASLVFYNIRNRRIADAINKQLNRLHQEDDATHIAKNATHRE